MYQWHFDRELEHSVFIRVRLSDVKLSLFEIEGAHFAPQWHFNRELERPCSLGGCAYLQ